MMNSKEQATKPLVFNLLGNKEYPFRKRLFQRALDPHLIPFAFLLAYGIKQPHMLWVLTPICLGFFFIMLALYFYETQYFLKELIYTEKEIKLVYLKKDKETQITIPTSSFLFQSVDVHRKSFRFPRIIFYEGEKRLLTFHVNKQFTLDQRNHLANQLTALGIKKSSSLL